MTWRTITPACAAVTRFDPHPPQADDVIDHHVRIRAAGKAGARGTGLLTRRATRPGCDRRAGLAGPSEDGGLDELREFCPNRRCNSTTKASSCSIRFACSSLTLAWATTNASNSSRDGSTPGTRRSSTPDGKSRTDTPDTISSDVNAYR